MSGSSETEAGDLNVAVEVEANAANGSAATPVDSEGDVASKEESVAAKSNNEDSPEVVQAVKERLHFFFSNANLRKDNFLRKKLAFGKNQIDVETLLKFNSIKALTTRTDTILKAAKTLSSLLTISDDSKRIGRVDPFDESTMMEGHIPLTLYLTNVPHADDVYRVSVREIRDFFEPYGPIAIIKLGFHSRRKAKGSCMVEFESIEGFEKAVKATVSKTECTEGLEESNNDSTSPELRKLMVCDGSVQISVSTLKDYLESKKNNADIEGDEEKDGTHENEEIEWKKGCVILMEGLAADCDREAILSDVADAMNVKVEGLKRKLYIDFSRGQTRGAIRFSEPTETQVADLCSMLMSGEVTIAGAKVGSAKVLDGEEEEKYWQDFIEFKKQRRLRHDTTRKPKRHRHR